MKFLRNNMLESNKKQFSLKYVKRYIKKFSLKKKLLTSLKIFLMLLCKKHFLGSTCKMRNLLELLNLKLSMRIFFFKVN